jgi:hypothetical protein
VALLATPTRLRSDDLSGQFCACHAGGLDGGGVNKDILAAAFRRHKAKALTRIEEFHCSNCHCYSNA